MVLKAAITDPESMTQVLKIMHRLWTSSVSQCTKMCGIYSGIWLADYTDYTRVTNVAVKLWRRRCFPVYRYVEVFPLWDSVVQNIKVPSLTCSQKYLWVIWKETILWSDHKSILLSILGETSLLLPSPENGTLHTKVTLVKGKICTFNLKF